MQRKLKLGMIGGGEGAFIGAVHRAACAIDDEYEFVAGALASTPERAQSSGRSLGLADDRNYDCWQAMLAAEQKLPSGERVDLVAIVTPNDTHFDIARAFVEAGIAVACDKPLCTDARQARELVEVADARNALFLVTYNYTGYPMVKQARALIQEGRLGEIRRVVVKYHQGWLHQDLEATGHKQAAWRTDPVRAGRAGALGDIGSHAENLVSYTTGLELESVCADLSRFVPGRRVDDDANVLLRFRNGARGILTASQVCTGSENDLRLQVWGTQGGLEWHQHSPQQLRWFCHGAPEQTMRPGHDYLAPGVQSATRLPAGHPEGFIEAFGNLYRNFGQAIREGAAQGASQHYDYPGVEDGARGIRFIEAALASAAQQSAWVSVESR